MSDVWCGGRRQKHIQNPIKHLRWKVLRNGWSFFMLHLRFRKGLWRCLWGKGGFTICTQKIFRNIQTLVTPNIHKVYFHFILSSISIFFSRCILTRAALRSPSYVPSVYFLINVFLLQTSPFSFYFYYISTKGLL